MICNLKSVLSAAALAAGLAAAPASAQLLGAPAGGHVGGGAVGGGFHGGGAIADGGLGRAGGGHIGGPPIAAPTITAPTIAAPPISAPQLHAPQIGGGFSSPHHTAGVPGLNGWSGGAPAVQHPGWAGGGGLAQPQLPALAWRHGGHHGRGHWRGGVWVPYVVGGYGPYVYDGYGDDDCALRRVRVHTRYGWRLVWRQVCT